VELICVTGRSQAGKTLAEVFPHLTASDLVIQPELDSSVDVVFSAMPHKASAEVCAPFVSQGLKVIDISADFRLKDRAEYEAWYAVEHPCPHLLESAVYGLPELHHEEIKKAQLVANPGCYPTGAILAMAPAMASGIVSGDIIVDSKSGVSGAGRSLTLATHYAECNESVAAYAVGGHRHMPEIRQECALLNPGLGDVVFQPHLIPMSRGILSTCYARLSPDWITRGEKVGEDVSAAYRYFYRDAPFTAVVDAPPATKQVWGSNYCHVYLQVDARKGRLLVISAIDNLVRGGAGEAVQNMNLMCGFPETCGLEALPVYP
jgi:N-acetyl-gamma-glutamyl-phosphate reductase